VSLGLDKAMPAARVMTGSMRNLKISRCRVILVSQDAFFLPLCGGLPGPPLVFIPIKKPSLTTMAMVRAFNELFGCGPFSGVFDQAPDLRSLKHHPATEPNAPDTANQNVIPERPMASTGNA
jgi:hypothetical protein